MRRALFIVLGLVVGCSSKDASESRQAPQSKDPVAGSAKEQVRKLASAEQACDALTPAEVEAELHEKTTAHMLPKAGEYGAPECGWFVSDAPDAHGVSVAMFFQDNEADAKRYFAKKLDTVCSSGKREAPNLGDEAAFCGRLWVRKGTSFFSVSVARVTGTPDERIQVARHLAERVLPHLP
ncbi:MAG TPA: hypothetical protein VFT22_19325 [Kofleriaceae bacterium]|nr:hypothetical protein [Kofleriaceae bacterium]